MFVKRKLRMENFLQGNFTFFVCSPRSGNKVYFAKKLTLFVKIVIFVEKMVFWIFFGKI